MYKHLLLLFFTISFFFQAEARILRSVQSGNWGDASTWDLGAPAAGDTIFIESTHIVTVDAQYTYTGALMLIQVEGTLNFDNGKKLDLPANSGVLVVTGGSLTGGGGGGSSNLINSGAAELWKSGDGDKAGPFATGNTPTFPLPIQVIFFDAIDTEEGIMIFWKSTNVSSVCSYEIYRSHNLNEWEKIDTQFVAEDHSQTNFQFIDNESSNEENYYYYLKEISCNGTEFFSRVVSVRHSVANKISVYPNPARDYFNVIHSSNKALTIEVINHNGQVVLKDQTNSNFHEVLIRELKPGFYIVRIGNDSHFKNLHLVIK